MDDWKMFWREIGFIQMDVGCIYKVLQIYCKMEDLQSIADIPKLGETTINIYIARKQSKK